MTPEDLEKAVALAISGSGVTSKRSLASARAAIRIVAEAAKGCVADESETLPHDWHATRQVMKCIMARIDELIPLETKR